MFQHSASAWCLGHAILCATATALRGRVCLHQPVHLCPQTLRATGSEWTLHSRTHRLYHFWLTDSRARPMPNGKPGHWPTLRPDWVMRARTATQSRGRGTQVSVSVTMAPGGFGMERDNIERALAAAIDAKSHRSPVVARARKWPRSPSADGPASRRHPKGQDPDGRRPSARSRERAAG